MDEFGNQVQTLESVHLWFLNTDKLFKKLQELISNSWGKHKANQNHDGDFIPDKTYWRQKDSI